MQKLKVPLSLDDVPHGSLDALRRAHAVCNGAKVRLSLMLQSWDECQHSFASKCASASAPWQDNVSDDSEVDMVVNADTFSSSSGNCKAAEDRQTRLVPVCSSVRHAHDRDSLSFCGSLSTV